MALCCFLQNTTRRNKMAKREEEEARGKSSRTHIDLPFIKSNPRRACVFTPLLLSLCHSAHVNYRMLFDNVPLLRSEAAKWHSVMLPPVPVWLLPPLLLLLFPFALRNGFNWVLAVDLYHRCVPWCGSIPACYVTVCEPVRYQKAAGATVA